MHRYPGRPAVASGLVLLVTGALLVVGAVAFYSVAVSFHVVAGPAMEPTLRSGDRVAVERVAPEEVRRGEVVVVDTSEWYPDSDEGGPTLLRAVAVGGDTLVCCGPSGELLLNGTALEEPYVAEGSGVEFRVTVPEGRLFVLGDNRRDSSDSRFRLWHRDGAFRLERVDGTLGADRVSGRVAGVMGESGFPAASPLAPAGAAGSGSVAVVNVPPIAFAAGFVVALVGLVALVVGLVRRSRARNAPPAGFLTVIHD